VYHKFAYDTMEEFWEKPQIPYIIAKYPDLMELLPFKHKEIRCVPMTKHMNIEDYLNYTATWSAWTTVEKKIPRQKARIIKSISKRFFSSR